MILFGVLLVVHILLSVFLIVIILLQGGRGGLGEALGGAAVQSLFGGGANLVMTKITAACAGLFMVTCLSLAALSTARGRSVIERLPAGLPETLPESVAGVVATTAPSASPAQDAAPASP